jgi:hypothetical protein
VLCLTSSSTPPAPPFNPSQARLRRS